MRKYSCRKETESREQQRKIIMRAVEKSAEESDRGGGGPEGKVQKGVIGDNSEERTIR